jgi:aminoglycoside phosphotransferase (APT) family kinase protein
MDSLENTSTQLDMIPPLTALTELATGEWMPLPPNDPVAEFITKNYLTSDIQSASWEAARFSRAVYLYREISSKHTLVVKYYSEKTGLKAARYARREMEFIEEVMAAGLSDGRLRSMQPLGTWRGILFLEHIKGLTLGDMIAVRQSQPGRLLSALANTAALLGKLHTKGVHPEELPSFDAAAKDAHKYINQLATSSLLISEPTTVAGLHRLIEDWTQRHMMVQFTPTLTHGDATTTNFIFPDDDNVVAIDWERLKIADPAADIGRLAAEITHSVRQQGGSGAEVDRLVEHLTSAYHQAVCAAAQSMHQRINFYQAVSTLRIARNGWLSRLERMMLVAQAMAMLV